MPRRTRKRSTSPSSVALVGSFASAAATLVRLPRTEGACPRYGSKSPIWLAMEHQPAERADQDREAREPAEHEVEREVRTGSAGHRAPRRPPGELARSQRHTSPSSSYT